MIKVNCYYFLIQLKMTEFGETASETGVKSAEELAREMKLSILEFVGKILVQIFSRDCRERVKGVLVGGVLSLSATGREEAAESLSLLGKDLLKKMPADCGEKLRNMLVGLAMQISQPTWTETILEATRSREIPGGTMHQEARV